MSGFEPYVADPAEPAPQRALGRRRLSVGVSAGIVLLVALAVVGLRGRPVEDPSFDVPVIPTPAASPSS